jgi:hypothetical protein
MPVAAVRAATADTETPTSKLEAHGNVEVNGAADAVTPRMGPPRPRSETVTPVLSPARAALADHITHLAKLSAEADRKARPVERVREQLSLVTDELRRAEAALDAIYAQHSAAIVEAARADSCSTEPPETVKAESAVARARRNCNSVRMALDECQKDQVRANSNLEAAKTAFDAILLRICVEEHEAHLIDWARKRDAFHLAEIDLMVYSRRSASAGATWSRAYRAPVWAG